MPDRQCLYGDEMGGASSNCPPRPSKQLEERILTLVMIRQIRKVRNGYIVEARWPIGDTPAGYGEVLCHSIDDVIKTIRETDPDISWKDK